MYIQYTYMCVYIYLYIKIMILLSCLISRNKILASFYLTCLDQDQATFFFMALPKFCRAIKQRFLASFFISLLGFRTEFNFEFSSRPRQMCAGKFLFAKMAAAIARDQIKIDGAEISENRYLRFGKVGEFFFCFANSRYDKTIMKRASKGLRDVKKRSVRAFFQLSPLCALELLVFGRTVAW